MTAFLSIVPHHSGFKLNTTKPFQIWKPPTSQRCTKSRNEGRFSMKFILRFRSKMGVSPRKQLKSWPPMKKKAASWMQPLKRLKKKVGVRDQIRELNFQQLAHCCVCRPKLPRSMPGASPKLNLLKKAIPKRLA